MHALRLMASSGCHEAMKRCTRGRGWIMSGTLLTYILDWCHCLPLQVHLPL